MRLAAAKTLDVVGLLTAAGKERKLTSYKKNQTIFSQGDRSDAMFYIVNGSVKLAVVSRAGKEAIIAISGPGRLFGESCISVDDPVRFESAVALTDARLVRVDSTAIMRMLRAGGDTSVNFISFILMQNAQIREDLSNRLVDSAEESLARVVSSLVQFRDKDASLGKISQQTIGEMIGITRQRVNVLMKRYGLTPTSRDSLGKGSPSKNSADRKFRTSLSLPRVADIKHKH
jgi:CRP/FNR family transcriptional regulator, cyclic AMP receptor protein